MGDTKINDNDSLFDYNDEDPDDLTAGKTQGTLDKGDGTSSDPLDWTFDEEVTSRNHPVGRWRTFNISSE